MNLRVAVADDEPMNLRRLARLLEEAGCEVVATFQDGDAVIAWAEEQAADYRAEAIDTRWSYDMHRAAANTAKGIELVLERLREVSDARPA